MTPVTCMTIQLEIATSPLLVPTTTHNLKSPPPLCQAHGEHPLRVKPGKLTPPSLPQPQPPLHHPPTQCNPTVSTSHHMGILLAPPLIEGSPCHVISSATDHNNDSGMGILTAGYWQGWGISTTWWAYRQQGMYINRGHAYWQQAGILTAGQVYWQQAGVLTMGKAYWWWGSHIDSGECVLMVGNTYWWWGRQFNMAQKNARQHFTYTLPRWPHSPSKVYIYIKISSKLYANNRL